MVEIESYQERVETILAVVNEADKPCFTLHSTPTDILYPPNRKCDMNRKDSCARKRCMRKRCSASPMRSTTGTSKLHKGSEIHVYVPTFRT